MSSPEGLSNPGIDPGSPALQADVGSWGRKWPPTPVFLPRKPHGQRGLACDLTWGRKRIRHDLAAKQQTKVNLMNEK